LPLDLDDALDDLHILISVCKAVGHGWEKAEGFFRRWVPRMTELEAKRTYDKADLATAYLGADTLAKRLGITWALRCSLNLRTIGCIDKTKDEREAMRRAKADAKRKQDKAAKPTKLKPREEAVMRMIGLMLGMGDICRKASRHRLFYGVDNVPLEVRRIIARLVKRDLLGRRLEPRDKGGKEWFVWKVQREETTARQPDSKNAPRQATIFTESNRGADLCVNIPVGDTVEHQRRRSGHP
jgi:hypothetical protein